MITCLGKSKLRAQVVDQSLQFARKAWHKCGETKAKGGTMP